MPEILRRNGWKFNFYANEGSEGTHIHCKKGEKNGKFYLLRNSNKIIYSRSNKMNNKDKNDVIEIINQNYDFILEMWDKYFKL